MKFIENQITLVVTTHALADCIESYATDMKMRELVELSKKIRAEADRYGDEFSNLSDYLKERLDNLKYNKSQLLPVLCFILHRECKKIKSYFQNDNPLSEYTQMAIANEIKKYSENVFLSKEMITEVSSVLMDLRLNNFVK